MKMMTLTKSIVLASLLVGGTVLARGDATAGWNPNVVHSTKDPNLEMKSQGVPPEYANCIPCVAAFNLALQQKKTAAQRTVPTNGADSDVNNGSVIDGNQ